MTTDNRTPKQKQNGILPNFACTDEQVEAAAKALEEHRHVMVAPGPHRCSCGYVLDGWAAAHKLHAARAALVAAQEAAPQDGYSEEWLSWCREESCVHRHWRSGGMPTHRRGDDCPTPGNHAPVQPSSTVDEVAEVVRNLKFNDAGCWAGGIDCTESVADHADEIARAVVEAIGGEGQWEYMRVDPRGEPVWGATFDEMPLLDPGWTVERRFVGPWLAGKESDR